MTGRGGGDVTLEPWAGGSTSEGPPPSASEKEDTTADNAAHAKELGSKPSDIKTDGAGDHDVWLTADGTVKLASSPVRDALKVLEEWKDCWSIEDSATQTKLDRAITIAKKWKDGAKALLQTARMKGTDQARKVAAAMQEQKKEMKEFADLVAELLPKIDDTVMRTKGVVPYQVGTYGELRRLSDTGDFLDLDHQPSNASNKERLQDYSDWVTKAGPAIAVPREIHAQGCTYRGRNNEDRVTEDAEHPDVARKRDIDVTIRLTRENRKKRARAAKPKILGIELPE